MQTISHSQSTPRASSARTRRRLETPEARRHRLRGWRPRIDAAVAQARARQLPLLTIGRQRWDAAAWLKPKPIEAPDPGPRRIPADRDGLLLVGDAILSAYLEARAERASTTT